MRELNLDQLKTLVTVVDLGSFSAAAQALHLAQPTVSLHVSELESRLEAQLIVRGSRRISPTSAGAALIARARHLLLAADEAIDAVRRHVAGLAGRVRLGASTGVVAHLLPQVLAALGKEHPGIDVQVSILTSHETMVRLEGGSLDIGLVAMPQRPLGDLMVTHWRKDPMMAFVPANWQAPKRVTPQWLAAQPLILNDPTTRLYRLTMEWFAAAGYGPRARIELNYTDAMKSLVAAGYGAALLPLEQPADSAAHRQLQVLPLKPGLWRSLGVAHRAASVTDGATRNVLQTLARFRQS